MREKRSTTFFMIFLIFLVVFDQSEAWWGRRSSSSSRRSSSGSGKSSNGNSGSGSSGSGKISSGSSSSGTISSGSSGSGKDDSKSGSEGYISGFINGAKEMHKAYKDMKEANYIGADKYFHARGNADAAKHGTGGRHAAKVISDLREGYGWLKGDPAEDRAADQEANEHGRNGGDPNKYRPKGLPDKYKK